MRIYLDDDSASGLLVRLLRNAGHDVHVPADAGMSGEPDPVHLRHAIRADSAIISRNYEDFEHLHLLVMEARGHHPGILVQRFDNNSKNNLKPHDIVRAIRNLEASSVPIADQYHVLNQWQ